MKVVFVTISRSNHCGLAETLASIKSLSPFLVSHPITFDIVTVVSGDPPRDKLVSDFYDCHCLFGVDNSLYNAMNFGLSAALRLGCDYVSFINSGESILASEYSSFLCEVLNRRSLFLNSAMFSCSYVVVGPFCAFRVPSVYSRSMLWDLPMQCATLIPSKVASGLRFDESLTVAADLDFFLCILSRGFVSRVHIACLAVAFRSGGISSFLSYSQYKHRLNEMIAVSSRYIFSSCWLPASLLYLQSFCRLCIITACELFRLLLTGCESFLRSATK